MNTDTNAKCNVLILGPTKEQGILVEATWKKAEECCEKAKFAIRLLLVATRELKLLANLAIALISLASVFALFALLLKVKKTGTK